MIRRIYRKIRNFKNSVFAFFIRRRFEQNAILVGKNQKFFASAGILLNWGAKKENVIIYDYCSIFGSI